MILMTIVFMFMKYLPINHAPDTDTKKGPEGPFTESVGILDSCCESF